MDLVALKSQYEYFPKMLNYFFLYKFINFVNIRKDYVDM